MSYEKKMIKTMIYIFILISSLVIAVLLLLKLYHMDGINRYLLLVTAITAVTGCIGKVEKYDTFLEVIALYACAFLYIIVGVEACVGNMKLSDEDNVIIIVLTFLFAILTIYIYLCDEWNNEIMVLEGKLKDCCKKIWKKR